MTSTQRLLSLLVQRAIAFLVTASPKSLLSAAESGDIQTNPSDSRDLAIGATIGAAQAVRPQHGPVRPHGAEYEVPFVFLPAQQVVDVTEHSRAVLLVNTRDPRIERLRVFRAEAVL